MYQSDKEQITECYKQMYRGMIEKDRAILNTVLDESFILVHMTGMRQSADEYIRAIENGTLNYYSAVDENITVSVNAEEAHLIGQSLVEAAVFGGGRSRWKLQLEIQMKKKNGCWMMTKAAASTY